MNLKSTVIILLILFLQLYYIFANAQVNIDSLKYQIKSVSLDNEEKSEIAVKIADSLIFSQTDSAEFYALSGLEMAKKEKFAKGIFLNNYTLGRIELTRDNLEGAADYFEKALSISDQLKDISLSLNAYQMLAYVYDMQNQYLKAYQVYNEGIQIAEENKDSVKLYSLYNNFGSHLQNSGNHSQAKQLFRKTLDLARLLSPEDLHFSPSSALSNLATIYLEEEDTDSAFYYLRMAWSYPGSHEDIYGELIMASNFSELFLKVHNTDSLQKYLAIQEKDLQLLSRQFRGSVDPLYLKYFAQLGEFQYNHKNFNSARQNLSRALDLSKKIDEYQVRTEVLSLLSDIENDNENFEKALDYMSRYAESLDSLNKRKAGDELLRLKLQNELNSGLMQSKIEMQRLRFEKDQLEMKVTVIFILATVVLVIIGLLYKLQESRHKRLKSEEAMHRLEKEKVAEELEFKKKELTTNAIYAAQRENLVQLITKKLKELMVELPTEKVSQIEKLLHELEKNSPQNNWQEFEKRFNEVHTDFYERLSKAYPKLTAGDLRLCGFLRLNMSNKEIAAITYQNVESLKTARYRLRKKLGLSREVNLVHFLTRF